MRFTFLKPLAIAGLAFSLSACAQQALLPTSEVSFVDKVDVELKTEVKSARFAEMTKIKTRREATRYGRSGAMKALRIAVTRVHHKNPALSLLIGDSNNATAHVTVVDAATGRQQAEFDASTVDTFAINGVVGAVMAATQNDALVEEHLAQGLASDVMEKIYGTEAAEAARRRSYVDLPPEPVAVPATPAAPVSAAPVAPAKAKKAEPKTAMVAPPQASAALRPSAK